jgi:hypothetical protein
MGCASWNRHGRRAGACPCRDGAQALREIGIRGLPVDWPVHAPVYASASEDRSRWLLVLPSRGQLWYGWME